MTIDTRGQCSNFVDGENFDGMIPDRSGDFDDQSIDSDPVWRRGARARASKPIGIRLIASADGPVSRYTVSV